MDAGQNALKTASKKVVYKAAEVTGKFLGNKIADTVTKSSDDKIVKQKSVIDEDSRNVEEIITPPEKREEILNKKYYLDKYYKHGTLKNI